MNDENTADELKEVCQEILDDVESLEENLDNLKQRIQMLDNEIATYLEKSAKTEMTIDEIFDLLYANVGIKKKLKQILGGIDDYSKTLNEYRKKYLMKKAESPPKKTYKAAKGDVVDEMLGNWINTHGCEIEIRRLGGGFYMFGEKKIYAKIINGKLIIRVGGGYMNIDEFMQHYGVMEIARQQRIYEMEYESLNYDELMSTEDDMSNPPNRKDVIGIHEAKKGLRSNYGGSFVNNKAKASPLRGSPRAVKTGRHGSPTSSFIKQRQGSPRQMHIKPGTPGDKSGGMFRFPSAAKIEQSLKKLEDEAMEGKAKDGYHNASFRK